MKMNLLKLITLSLLIVTFHANAGHPRCAGNPEREKCEALEKKLASETPEQKKLREKELEKSRYSAMDEVKKSNSTAEGNVILKVKRWWISGFGTIAIADFQISNGTSQPIKDIVVQCETYAPSGTRLGSVERVIYDVVKTKSTRSFNEFNMGLIHSQTGQLSCDVLKYKN